MLRICNAYGGTECTFNSTINWPASDPTNAINIGTGAGLVTWVVDAQDHDRLLPPGCDGELLLEGPLVGAGYLGDPEKTASTFIKPPSWLIRGRIGQGQKGQHGQLYKTGDLVRYNRDGSLKFLGR